MAQIPKELIDKIQQDVDIVDVISQYVQLTKRGQNHVASCPFHEDQNPSFSVSPSKQIYKCFSCGRGGTVFGFLQEMEGISFPEAVIKAADFASQTYDLTAYQQLGQSQEPDHADLYQIHDKAQAFYHYYLLDTVAGEGACAYFSQRKFKLETLRDFGLGLSPDQPEILYQYLAQEGFSDEALLESGIFYRRDDRKILDRFHGRIIFPLRSIQGQVLGFSGRIFEKDQEGAKYINSPETPIFKKSSLLFNLDKAKGSIRKAQSTLVAEGYMDVMALSQAGFTNVVATMGTALSRDHLDRINKLSKEVIFVFDGDDAGRQATDRAFDMALPFPGLQAKTIQLAAGLDPDQWIQDRGPAAFEKLIHHAKTAYEFKRDYLRDQVNLANKQDLAQYIESLLGLIKGIDSPIEQEIRLQELSQEFSIEASLLKEQLARIKSQARSKKRDQAPQTQDLLASRRQDLAHRLGIKSYPAFQSEKMILLLLIYYQEAWDFMEAREEPFFMLNSLSQEAYMVLQEYYYDEGYPLPLKGVMSRLESPELNQLFTQLIWDQERVRYQEGIMDDCIQVIETEFVKEDIKEMMQELNQAQINQLDDEVNRLLVAISRRTKEIKG